MHPGSWIEKSNILKVLSFHSDKQIKCNLHWNFNVSFSY